MPKIGTLNTPAPYKTDKVQAWCEDCFETFARLKDKSIDMVLVDPPYQITDARWDSLIPIRPMWTQIKRVIKPGRAVVFTASFGFGAQLMMANHRWFKYDLVWDKVTAVGFLNAKVMPMRSHETVLVFCDGSPLYNPQMKPCAAKVVGKHRKATQGTATYKLHNDLGKDNGRAYDMSAHASYPTNVVTEEHPRSILKFQGLTNGKGGGRIHPTQKPLGLFEWLIRTYSNPGDTVLDFAMGSGTTLAACLTGRQGIGCDSDQEHYLHAIARLTLLERRLNK